MVVADAETMEQTVQTQENVASDTSGNNELDIVDQAARQAEADIAHETLPDDVNNDNEFINPDVGAVQNGHEVESGSPTQKPKDVPQFKDMNEALGSIRDRIGEEQFQLLTNQYTTHIQKSQLMDGLMQIPQVRQVILAALGRNEQPINTPVTEPPAEEDIAIDLTEFNKALEEGTDPGRPLSKAIGDVLKRERARIQQERTQMLSQLTNRMNDVVSPINNSLQVQESKAAFGTFAATHPGLMEDTELRKVMGDLIRENPQWVQNIQGDPEAYNRVLGRVLKYAQAELGRGIKTTVPANRINRSRNMLAARMMGNTGRMVSGVPTHKRPETLEDAADLAEEQIEQNR